MACIIALFLMRNSRWLLCSVGFFCAARYRLCPRDPRAAYECCAKKRDSAEHELCAFGNLFYTLLYQWFTSPRRPVWWNVMICSSTAIPGPA